MRIVVAGAGAGKTTSMAQKVLERYAEVTDGKIIYVITYTNAARDRIRQKLYEINKAIPEQIKVETIHAFLLREVIFPFHHFLYDIQYTMASQILLPDNQQYKAIKIKELKENKIIHVEKVTEIAKWVISGKSSDNKAVKSIRGKILSVIQRYLDSVFIDEAQDMDEHLAKVIEVLNTKGINLYLVGDPKQDLRGRNTFRQLINEYCQHVEYITENYRCPVLHVYLSNLYIGESEKQVAQTGEQGELNYVLETDIDTKKFILNGGWEHVFIYNKNEKFITHIESENKVEQNLNYELKKLVKKSKVNEKDVNKTVFLLNKEILGNIHEQTNSFIFQKLEHTLSIQLTRQDMGKLAESLNLNRRPNLNEGILVQSIDRVKGLEGKNCLFILTLELAPYLFGERAGNKMMNYLYVALTRSKKKLDILVTDLVEEKYGREFIEERFKELLKIKLLL